MTATARLKQLLYIAAALALVGLGLVAAVSTASPARATDTTPCVPKDAYTETIEHPAETHTVHHEAVTHTVHHEAVTHVVHHDAVPGPWWNFSPNDTKGPFEGTPSFPTDAGGTWQGPHTEGGPSQDLTGTFQQGAGNAPWFHREAGQAAYDETVVDQEAYDEVVVDQEAYDETVVDKEAWTETIEHPAVTCDTPPADKKVVVCKYVGTPPGQLDHIVIVSENTLNNLVDGNGNSFAGTFPFSWTDAQGQTTIGSTAIRYATDGEQAQDVALSECPTPDQADVCPEGTDHAGDPFPVAGDETSCNDAPPPPDKKIVVCKYVGTPPGQLDHIVIVSENTLNNVVDANGNSFAGTFPFEWTDAQGQTTNGSIAIRYATDGEQAQDVALSECPAPDQADVCPEGTDHAGEPFPVEGDEASCNDAEPPVCPDGTDHAGEPFPVEGDEASCNDADQGPLTCPAGTDKAGQEIPADKTAEEFCDDDDDEVCPMGTDHAGEEVKHGEDPEKFCNDDEKPPVNPTDPTSPNGPSNHPNPGPTVKGAQATVPTASHSTPKAAGTPAALVPTAVDAGLAPPQRDLTGRGGPLGLLGIATALAGAVLVGASLRPRRRRSLTV